jgi:hypothetical protein
MRFDCDLALAHRYGVLPMFAIRGTPRSVAIGGTRIAA